jgi:hypothetical protein
MFKRGINQAVMIRLFVVMLILSVILATASIAWASPIGARA